MYKIYQITNIVNGKRYVGITKLSIKSRWNKHLKDSKNPKYPIHLAISKYGSSNFEITVLHEIEDRKYAGELEERTIQLLETRITQKGYNVAKGGYGGNLGPEAQLKRLETIRNFSPERKAEYQKKLHERNLGKTKENDPGRLSQSKKIKGNSFRKDIPHDNESKLKISKGNTGKIRSPESIEKYRKAAKIRGAKHFAGKKISCLCCKRNWDMGNFAQHIKRMKNEF